MSYGIKYYYYCLRRTCVCVCLPIKYITPARAVRNFYCITLYTRIYYDSGKRTRSTRDKTFSSPEFFDRRRRPEKE